VTQLVSSKVLSEKCKSSGKQPKLCVVAVLPHIIDGGAAAREGYLATVSGAAKKVTRHSDSPLLYYILHNSVVAVDRLLVVARAV
jgi:hypothetical protein